ncbi:hypothetical protein BJ684DRAFT_7823 [Piptocephalis cylindrospora]|uniref:Uncharacterized protein n=1 Tax=Piptocephalis cylindrospora TaxID=1907219 RepID=A0A4P9Y744_9FUNG|nr:hypothetical protein BJ684DRAFT_7823 [Piptocephalis cylindrospora]|eukprot:RKP14938.1 hypothetical protein BJ684DRAFT_7823 [Piptocephalis cylindrospora]
MSSSGTSSRSRVCLFPLNALSLLPPHISHELGVYIAGGLFALAWWIFLDAVTQARLEGISVGPEWAPGICVTLGMLVVNSIDQARLVGDSYGGSFAQDDGGWRARLAFFVGVAVMVGGIAGSVAILCVKFINASLPPALGWAGVIQCITLTVSSAILWIAQNAEGEYQIALSSM